MAAMYLAQITVHRTSGWLKHISHIAPRLWGRVIRSCCSITRNRSFQQRQNRALTCAPDVWRIERKATLLLWCQLDAAKNTILQILNNGEDNGKEQCEHLGSLVLVLRYCSVAMCPSDERGIVHRDCATSCPHPRTIWKYSPSCRWRQLEMNGVNDAYAWHRS